MDEVARIVDSLGALLVVDVPHVAGPVAAGQHLDPVPHVHVVTSTTRKTLGDPEAVSSSPPT